MKSGVDSVISRELEPIGDRVDPVSYGEGADVSRAEFFAWETHSDVPGGQPHLLTHFILWC